MMAVSMRVGAGDTPEIGAPRKIFEFKALLWNQTPIRLRIVLARNGRFLVNVSTDNGTPTINLITNWQKTFEQMTIAPGTRLGPYEIISAIGAGGMGEVYKARDTRLDRITAIKVLTSQLAGDPQFLERSSAKRRASRR